MLTKFLIRESFDVGLKYHWTTFLSISAILLAIYAEFAYLELEEHPHNQPQLRHY